MKTRFIDHQKEYIDVSAVDDDDSSDQTRLSVEKRSLFAEDIEKAIKLSLTRK